MTFKCEARGASPLKYTWMCDGDDLCLKDSWTVELKLEKGGRYNCRVENDFGSCISKYPLQLVCGKSYNMLYFKMITLVVDSILL